MMQFLQYSMLFTFTVHIALHINISIVRNCVVGDYSNSYSLVGDLTLEKSNVNKDLCNMLMY